MRNSLLVILCSMVTFSGPLVGSLCQIDPTRLSVAENEWTMLLIGYVIVWVLLFLISLLLSLRDVGGLLGREYGRYNDATHDQFSILETRRRKAIAALIRTSDSRHALRRVLLCQFAIPYLCVALIISLSLFLPFNQHLTCGVN